MTVPPSPPTTPSSPASHLPPDHPAHAWTDERVEHGVGNLLRIGVLLAAAVTLVGGTLYLLQSAWTTHSYRVFQGVTDGLNSISGILRGVGIFDSRAIIQLGIVLLIATPVARVALSLLGFFRQRDRTYMVITTIVLIILLLGLSGKIRTH